MSEILVDGNPNIDEDLRPFYVLDDAGVEEFRVLTMLVEHGTPPQSQPCLPPPLSPSKLTTPSLSSDILCSVPRGFVWWRRMHAKQDSGLAADNVGASRTGSAAREAPP
jgi:hypothetical protein